MDEVIKLIKANECDEDMFISLLHQTLLLFILEEVCQRLKEDPTLMAQKKSEYRKKNNHTKVSQRLVYELCGTNLGEEDSCLLSEWIKAFLKKSGVRKPIAFSERQRLLDIQDYKCACCGQPITIEIAHYDHIIPWDYVGDELENNGQMLCAYCNEHKSNSVYYLLKRQLIKKNK